MSQFNRVSLQDLKDDGEVEIDEEVKIDTKKANRSGHVSEAIDTSERLNSSEDDEKNTLPSTIGSEKTTGLLRRSLSDVGDGSVSLDDKALGGKEVESSLQVHEKHRGSLTSTSTSSSSPVLKRRQTTLDSAFHNLLQEGKDFLHRKRQQVPRFGSHFMNKAELLSTHSMVSTASSEASSHSGDPHSSALGTIFYHRKDDSVSLDSNQEIELDAEKVIVKVHTLPPMEDGDQLMDSAEDLTTIANGTGMVPPVEKFGPALAKSSPATSKKFGSNSGNPLQPPPSPTLKPRPTSLPQTVVEQMEKANVCPRHHDGDSVVATALAPFTSPHNWSSPFWKYYKEIIGVVLLALTVGQYLIGFSSGPLFVLGLSWGIYLTFRAATIIFWFCLPPDRYPSFGGESEPTLTVKDMLESAETEEELVAEDTVVYKGWMNRLPTKYDPDTYHINMTHSVLVRLDRNILRLSTPRVNLGRHAYCREQRMTPAFISQEMYDMTGACVFLRPKGLAHRRWWSRKYPISIVFPPKSSDTDGTRRRDSSPVTPPSLKAQMTAIDEKAASDTGSISSELDAKVPPVGELAVDALMEGVHGHDGTQLTEEESEVTDDEDEDEQSSLRSTLSLPSNLGLATKKAQTLRKRRQYNRRKVVNLFGRSMREKENWFYRLRQAACYYSYADRRERFRRIGQDVSSGNPFYDVTSDDPDIPPAVGVPFLHNLSSTTDDDDFMKKKDPLATEWILYISMQQQYEKHMRDYMPQTHGKLEVQAMDLISHMWKTWMGPEADVPDFGGMYDSRAEAPTPMAGMSIDWANAFGSRIFYDFSRNPTWMGKVRDKIQHKLATLRLPYFIEMLKLASLEPGTTAPRITAVNDPSVNEWGLWVDVKMEYLGGLRLVLETKVNLMKLKHDSEPQRTEMIKERIADYTNNDFPESPESSPDEDAPTDPHQKEQHSSKPGGHESKKKKVLNFVDKIAHSKPFQAAADNKYVKKLMQNVSETPLVLEVEVVYLCGALAINIPPPPSDRLWYGFRFPPKIILKARPRVGEHVVNLSRITDWIENKLVLLVEKNLVVPNLDDLIVPIMGGSPLYRNFNR